MRLFFVLCLITTLWPVHAIVFDSGFETIKKPGPDNTGPSDASLLQISPSLTIQEDGAVIENVDIVGRIKIEADHVTVRNFRIDGGGTHYGIQVVSGHTGILIEDGEIFNINSAAILGVGFTARRLNVHDSGGDGFKVQGSGGPTLIKQSWIHHLGKNDGAHADGNQTRGGIDIAFRYNNCDMPITDPAPYKSNACFILQEAGGTVDNFEIRNNWLNGGNYTIYCGGTDNRITGNRFGRDYRFGYQNGCNNMVWENNMWEDTGEPVPISP